MLGELANRSFFYHLGQDHVLDAKIMLGWTIEEYLKDARYAIDEGDIIKAEGLFDYVLQADSNNPEAKLGAAEVKYVKGRTSEAVADAVSIAVNNPLDADLLTSCARLLKCCGSEDLAVRVDEIAKDARTASQILQISLGSELTMADFGSSDESIVKAPRGIAEFIHFISLDAVNVGACKNNFGKYTPITCVIADKAGETDFYERFFIQGSSMLETKNDILDDFGLRSLSAIKAIRRVVTRRLPDLLIENKILKLDYLKTDLEGMDGAVIRDSKDFICGTAVVQAELRFLPCFKGEPYFDEIVSYMRDQNFEILHVTTENWRYSTTCRDYVKRGRSVWADVVFVKNIEAYFEFNGRTSESLVRYCLICGLSGNVNYAEHILAKYKYLTSDEVYIALLHYLVPEASFGNPSFSRAHFGHVALL